MNKQRMLNRLYSRLATLTAKYRRYSQSSSENNIFMANDLAEQMNVVSYQISDLEGQIEREQHVR